MSAFGRCIPEFAGEESGNLSQAHKAGKKVFLIGLAVADREVETRRKAKETSVDAILTDYPLECRRLWRALERP